MRVLGPPLITSIRIGIKRQMQIVEDAHSSLFTKLFSIAAS